MFSLVIFLKLLHTLIHEFIWTFTVKLNINVFYSLNYIALQLHYYIVYHILHYFIVTFIFYLYFYYILHSPFINACLFYWKTQQFDYHALKSRERESWHSRDDPFRTASLLSALLNGYVWTLVWIWEYYILHQVVTELPRELAIALHSDDSHSRGMKMKYIPDLSPRLPLLMSFQGKPGL